ncbi:hypothetical protein MBLNU230_g3045t1 [Neophaeotheca triangularis]
MKTFTTTLTSLSALALTAGAVNPIETQRQEFINSVTGDRYFVIGVDYQPGGEAGYGTGAGDPLTNGTTCLRDAALMQELSVNTIRTYNIDPTLNHDDCASIFNEVGIYMMLDVNSPLAGESINRGDPESSYTLSYLERIFSLVHAFKDYPNTAAFISANEVIDGVGTVVDNPPYLRAVVRDLKQYIRENSDRPIPVGYSAADVREVLFDTWEYLQCDNSDNDGNDDSRADFFGLNSYSWCGADATFESSTFDQLIEFFGQSTVPVFFTEYGCDAVHPRPFDEVLEIYGPRMTTMSGGLVYQWSNEIGDYGLTQAYANGSLQLLTDYVTLGEKYAQIDNDLLTEANDTATNLSPPTCSSDLIETDNFNTNFDLPEQPSGAADLISSGVTGISTGQIVSITQTSVQAPVYATDGAIVTDLAIRRVSSADAPDYSGLATGAAPTGTPSASQSGGGNPEPTESSSNGGGAGGSDSSGSDSDDDSDSDSDSDSTSTEAGGAFRAAATGMPLMAAVGAGLWAL